MASDSKPNRVREIVEKEYDRLAPGSTVHQITFAERVARRVRGRRASLRVSHSMPAQ